MNEVRQHMDIEFSLSHYLLLRLDGQFAAITTIRDVNSRPDRECPESLHSCRSTEWVLRPQDSNLDPVFGYENIERRRRCRILDEAKKTAKPSPVECRRRGTGECTEVEAILGHGKPLRRPFSTRFG